MRNSRFTRLRKRPVAIAASGALLIGGLVTVTANAQAPAPSLTGSNFEIEADANLILDGSAPNMDWASVAEIRKADEPTGPDDDSFGQGTKEDSPVPSIVDGSIPPNKSDLKFFGAYKEGDSSSGFLHLYWTRVQDPSGTTNMDFELNKGTNGLSTNGVTPVRMVGDLLITYDLSNGGTKAIMGKRTWDGSEWGPYTAFGDGDATGTINTSPIAAGDADGLGALSARTFGEASVRNSAIFGDGSVCTTYGYAYLKSRSSDSFTSAVKDFVAPVPINLTNCGSITVIKQTEPGGSAQSFTFGVSPAAGSPSTSSFNLTDADSTPVAGEAGVNLISNVQAGSYTISETVPAGWISASVVCTGASGTPTYGTASATVSVAASSAVVCTFTNTLKPKLTLIKQVTKDNGGTAVATDWNLSAAKDTTTITKKTGDQAVAASFWKVMVDAGTYALSESGGPAGYTPSHWVCTGATSSTTASVTLANGDDATCTITNDDSPEVAKPVLTVQKWVLHDSASIAGLRAGGGAATVTFTLWKDPECKVPWTVDGTAYSEVRPVTPEGGTTVSAATQTGFLATLSGETNRYYWKAVYSGNQNNSVSASECTAEATVISAKDDTPRDDFATP